MFPHVRLKGLYMVLRDGIQHTFVDVGGHIYSRVGEYGDFYGDLSRDYLCHLGLAKWVSGGHGPGHHIMGAYWPPEYRTRVPWPTGLHSSGPWPNLASFRG